MEQAAKIAAEAAQAVPRSRREGCCQCEDQGKQTMPRLVLAGIGRVSSVGGVSVRVEGLNSSGALQW